MSTMRHYSYYKSDIILRKPMNLLFSMQMSVCQQSVKNVTLSVIMARSGEFNWQNIIL